MNGAETWARLSWAKSPRRAARAGEPNLPSMGLFTHMLHSSAVAMEIMQTNWGQWMASQMQLPSAVVAYLIGLHDLGKCSEWALARAPEQFEADPSSRTVPDGLAAQTTENLRDNLRTLLAFNATSPGGARSGVSHEHLPHHAGAGRTLSRRLLLEVCVPNGTKAEVAGLIEECVSRLCEAVSAHHGPPIKQAQLNLNTSPEYDYLGGARLLSRALWAAICQWEPDMPGDPVSAGSHHQNREKQLQGFLVAHARNHRIQTQIAQGDVQERINRTWALLSGVSTLCDWVASGPVHLLAANDPQAPLWHDPAAPTLEVQAAFNQERERARAALRQVGFSERADFTDLKLPEHKRGAAKVSLQMADHLSTSHGSFAVLRSPTGSGKTVAALEFIRAMQRKDQEVRGAHITLPTRVAGTGMWQAVIDRHLGPDAPNPVLVQGGAQTERNTRWRGHGREMVHPFGIGTIDQLLRGGMKGRFPQLRLTLLSRRVIVFDEIHAPGSYEHQLVINLLPWLRLLGCHVLVMSATLDSEREAQLVQAWRSPVSGGAPGLSTFPGIVMPGDHDVSGRVWQDSRQTLHSHRPMVSSANSGLQRLAPRLRSLQISGELDEESRRRAELDAATMLITGEPTPALHPPAPIWSGARAIMLTRVQHAQEMAARLRVLAADAPSIPLTLHGGLSDLVRREREDELRRRVGPPEEGEHQDSQTDRNIQVVATDVLGVSLDVDFDLLITDPSDAATFLQRAGRAGRHWRQHREGQGRRAEVVLIGPLDGGRHHPLRGHWALGHAPSSRSENAAYHLRPRHLVRLLSERLLQLPEDSEVSGARLITGTHHWHEGEQEMLTLPGVSQHYPFIQEQARHAMIHTQNLMAEGRSLALDGVPADRDRPSQVSEADTRYGGLSAPYLPVHWTGTEWHVWKLNDATDPLSDWIHTPLIPADLRAQLPEWPGSTPKDSPVFEQRRRLESQARRQMRESSRVHAWKSGRKAVERQMAPALQAASTLTWKSEPDGIHTPRDLLNLVAANFTLSAMQQGDEDEPRPEPRLGEHDIRLIPMRHELRRCGSFDVPTLVALDGGMRLDALIGLHLASDPASSDMTPTQNQKTRMKRTETSSNTQSITGEESID